MTPTKINFKIYQGSTFVEVLRYESTTKVYTNISAAFNSAPFMITANNHGMVAGWRCKLSNLGGMTEANNLDYIVASSVTNNDLVFNSVNAVGFKTYTTGGVLEYNEPISLANMTARMQIREKVTSSSVIDELTTENGMIVIDNDNKTIVIQIPASTTAEYTFKSAVYSLELVSDSIVIPFIYGNIVLNKEITR